MFFVVSTGRSGTQTLAELLDRSPDCVCPHEPEPRLLMEAMQYLYGKLPHDEAVALLRRTRPTIQTDKQYGESHHHLSLMIPALHDAFPQAKFVWLIRDGRKMVASLYARGAYKGYRFSATEGGILWETTRIRGDRVGDMSTLTWWGLSRFEKCCWHWDYRNRFSEQKLKECSCDWMLIRLEELEARSGDLFEFLGLQPPVEMNVKHLNVAKPVSGRREMPQDWREWNGEQVLAFLHFCAPVMDQWYPGWRAEVEDNWKEPGFSLKGWVWLKRLGRTIFNQDLQDFLHNQWKRWSARVRLLVPKSVRRILRARFIRPS